MKLIPLSLLAVLFLSGCERVRVRERSYPGGARMSSEGFVVRHGDTLLHGLRTAWYPDGRRESAETYAHGYLQGYSLHWYPDGRLRSAEHYSDGEPDGQAKYWDEEGRLSGCYDAKARDCLLTASREPEPERLVARPGESIGREGEDVGRESRSKAP